MYRAEGIASLRRGGAGGLLIHFGMLLATLAFASWWTSHTILDTARTRRTTDAVLENTEVRHFVADKVASVVAPSVGVPALNAAAGTNRATTAASSQAVLADRLGAVLDRRDIRTKLEQFIVDAHQRLIGEGTKPAVLDRVTVRTLVTAALPHVTAKDLAKVHAVTFDVPQMGALVSARHALKDRFLLYLLGALALVALAIATSRDRRATVKVVGSWLVGISVAHLIVLWIVPVVIVPHVSNSPWAGLIAAVARALNAGIVVGLVVLAATGVAFLLGDRFIAPARATPQLSPGVMPES